MKHPTSLVGILLSFACAPKTPGAQAHDMSDAQHAAEAAQQERVAAEHASQYDPSASVAETACGATDPHGARRVCWTSVTNPTSQHLEAAARHLQMAADHRAASAALVAAEGRACVGLTAEDRDMSPFQHVEDLALVKTLTEPHTTGKETAQVVVGAEVTVRAVPGLTAEWLQRIVDCHLARNAALGHVVPEMPDCPLVPKGATAEVTSTGAGFSVAVRSDDPVAAQDIVTRAQRLTPTTTR